MNLTPEALKREASATGFEQEMLEKVLRLIALLDGLHSHPFLKPRIALKGGTALNLYHFDVPPSRSTSISTTSGRPTARR